MVLRRQIIHPAEGERRPSGHQLCQLERAMVLQRQVGRSTGRGRTDRARERWERRRCFDRSGASRLRDTWKRGAGRCRLAARSNPRTDLMMRLTVVTGNGRSRFQRPDVHPHGEREVRDGRERAEKASHEPGRHDTHATETCRPMSSNGMGDWRPSPGACPPSDRRHGSRALDLGRLLDAS